VNSTLERVLEVAVMAKFRYCPSTYLLELGITTKRRVSLQAKIWVQDLNTKQNCYQFNGGIQSGI